MPLDSTYAPQSPDLSSFFSTSPSKTSNTSHNNINTNTNNSLATGASTISSTSSYAPRSPNLHAFSTHAYSSSSSSNHNYPQIPDLPPEHAFDALSQHQQQQQQQQQQHSHSHPLQQQQHLHPQLHQHQHHQQQLYHAYAEPSSSYSYQPPAPTSPSSLAYAAQPYPSLQYDPAVATGPLPPQPEEFHPHHDMSGRVKRERKPDVMAEVPEAASAGPSQGIEIKTKFPVARIKRIMQADEEVGKVAQVTPVAVSKALELFMITLVTRSAALARQGNAKRVTAQHLKRAIQADSQFDFLDEIVAKVVEGPDAGGKKVKGESDSDEDGAPRKKARGKKKGGE